MKNLNVANIVGAILVIAGILLVIFQMILYGMQPVMLGADIGITRWVLSTQYPGIIMICVGAALIIVGRFGAKNPN